MSQRLSNKFASERSHAALPHTRCEPSFEEQIKIQENLFVYSTGEHAVLAAIANLSTQINILCQSVSVPLNDI